MECERAFNESKAKDHMKEMLRLLQTDDLRWVAAHYISSSDLSSGGGMHPCIDIFLVHHMTGKLCAYAIKDIPRGSMALILTFLASLLRCIRYPLLPHQSVHVPLSQLISNAMRISNSSSVLNSQQEHEEFLNYKRKIGIV